MRMTLIAVPMLVLNLAAWAGVIYLVVLLIRALKKYLSTEKPNEQQQIIVKKLGEVIKEHRTRCGMTQEFVAEQLGISRQAVSKWENGTSEPTTCNLLALAQLFEIPAEELLRSVQRP